MGWNYSSISKLQLLHRWSLGIDTWFHSTLYSVCDYLSILGLKLIHVNKSWLWTHCGLDKRATSYHAADISNKFLLMNCNGNYFLYITKASIANKSHMMTSSNGNIFRVTGHLCGEFTGPGEFPTQRPVTRSYDVFFDLRLNKRLSKQS